MALKQPVSARNRFRFTKGFCHPIFNAAACRPSMRDWRQWVDAIRQQAGQDGVAAVEVRADSSVQGRWYVFGVSE